MWSGYPWSQFFPSSLTQGKPPFPSSQVSESHSAFSASAAAFAGIAPVAQSRETDSAGKSYITPWVELCSWGKKISVLAPNFM